MCVLLSGLYIGNDLGRGGGGRGRVYPKKEKSVSLIKLCFFI